MDWHSQPREVPLLPVQVWGVDANARPFIELVGVKNLGGNGAVVQGVRSQIKPGEILEVRCGGQRAQFRVLWAGMAGTRREGEIGIESLPTEPCIWGVNLQQCSQFVGQG